MTRALAIPPLQRVPETRRGGRFAGLALIAGLLLLTNLLVIVEAFSPLRGPVAMAVAVILPGALTIRALRLTVSPGWPWLLYVVALSLAGLLVAACGIGLTVGRLTTASCLTALDTLVIGLALVAAWRSDPRSPARVSPDRSSRAWSSLPWPDRFGAAGIWSLADGVAGVRSRAAARISPSAVIAVVLGGAAVAAAVLGAARLNAGGGSGWSELGLALAAATLGTAAYAARRHPTAAATAVYLLALAVLFATSLRGTAVTGHDIKLEYRVFTDVLNSGYWRPKSTFAGYNSCLSITMLSGFLARLSGIAALDVFRVCFQMLFAVVPVGVLLVARRFVPTRYAVLAAGLFVAFPTFVNDMPMLNRQEIALIFFTVLMLIVTGARTPGRAGRRQRTALLGILLGGLTVSHYSTAYVAIVLLLGAWLFRQLRRSAQRTVPATHAVLGGCGLALLVFTLFWATMTDSASAVGASLKTAAAAVTGQFSAGDKDARLEATVGPVGGTEQAALEWYVAQVIRPSVGTAPDPGCAPIAEPAETLRMTPVGAVLNQAGVPPGDLNGWLRQAAVVVFEGGAALGVLILLIRELGRSARPRRAPTALAELSVTGFLLLALPVVAPGLSASYGPQRLYQQMLIVLGPAVLIALRSVLGIRAARAGRRPSRVTGVCIAMIVVGCLLSTSGLIPNLTGGYEPQLNLNNSGPTYHTFYADGNDKEMTGWIRDHLQADTTILADARDSLNLRAMTHLDPDGGLFPGAVPDTTHLLLRTADGQSATAMVILPDRMVRYRLPLACVTTGRPLLHAAGILRLYGPRTASQAS
ncbi:MAG: hypothetical protein QOC94_873 [Actinoplanes sp.]|nr:hypothetical protein [Actinoplanes sp.]